MNVSNKLLLPFLFLVLFFIPLYLTYASAKEEPNIYTIKSKYQRMILREPPLPFLYIHNTPLIQPVPQEKVKEVEQYPYQNTIKHYEWDEVEARAIMNCESGYNRRALNSSKFEYSVGLFQINLFSHNRLIPGKNWKEKQSWLYESQNNIQFAHFLYVDGGWTPWNNCARMNNLI